MGDRFDALMEAFGFLSSSSIVETQEARVDLLATVSHLGWKFVPNPLTLNPSMQRIEGWVIRHDPAYRT